MLCYHDKASLYVISFFSSSEQEALSCICKRIRLSIVDCSLATVRCPQTLPFEPVEILTSGICEQRQAGLQPRVAY